MIANIVLDRWGRVVIPKRLREDLNLWAGDSLRLESHGERITLSPVRAPMPIRNEDGVTIKWATARKAVAWLTTESRCSLSESYRNRSLRSCEIFGEGRRFHLPSVYPGNYFTAPHGRGSEIVHRAATVRERFPQAKQKPVQSGSPNSDSRKATFTMV